MRIIGIDPGYALLGFGLIDSNNSKLKVVDYGVISTASRVPFEQRLLAIYNGVRQLIDRYNPDVMAIEELFFYQNTTTAIGTAEARGVVILAAAQANIPMYEYKPSQVKNAVTGYGKSEKKQVQYMVKTLLNLKEIPKPDDAADALAVAIAHSNKGRTDYGQKLQGGYQ